VQDENKTLINHLEVAGGRGGKGVGVSSGPSLSHEELVAAATETDRTGPGK
jgi:hypothetical protein